MRRMARRWGRGLALAAVLLPAARAQTVPVAPVLVVRPTPATAAAPASSVPTGTPAATALPAAPAAAPVAPAASGTPVSAGAPAASVRTDTLRTVPAASPTFVADTARRVVVVNPAEPTDVVTHRTGLRIGTVILVLTLTTLLLYNVRSR